MRRLLLLFTCVGLQLIPQDATAQTPCGYNPDANGDLLIGTTDLLSILNLWSETDSDGDCVWDGEDDCFGSYDACGVCNGPGPTIEVVDEILFATDSVFLEPIQQWYVFTYATDTLFTYLCPVPGCTDASALNFNPLAVVEDGSCSYAPAGPAACGGLASVAFDGDTYTLAGIGTQCWFRENLRSDSYRNGDAIPGSLDNSQWMATTSGAQAVYANNPANLASYGRLYNWYATSDARGLCPTGFHVPSDADWSQLELELGGAATAGAALKASTADPISWDGTNVSGFSAVPSGYRSLSTGAFEELGTSAMFWSATLQGSNAWFRMLVSGNAGALRGNTAVRDGFAVRCVKD